MISGLRRFLKYASTIRFPLSVTTGPTLPVPSRNIAFSDKRFTFANVA